MEKLKRKHPVEKIGDTSHESGDNLLSPKTILISRENSTPEEGMQCPFSKYGSQFVNSISEIYARH